MFAVAGEGDLRLVGRTDLGGGFVGGSLQAFIGGSFGSVCDFQFGPPDADMACRQLGFVGGSTGSLVRIDLERSEVRPAMSCRCRLKCMHGHSPSLRLCVAAIGTCAPFQV